VDGIQLGKGETNDDYISIGSGYWISTGASQDEVIAEIRRHIYDGITRNELRKINWFSPADGDKPMADTLTDAILAGLMSMTRWQEVSYSHFNYWFLVPRVERKSVRRIMDEAAHQYTSGPVKFFRGKFGAEHFVDGEYFEDGGALEFDEDWRLDDKWMREAGAPEHGPWTEESFTKTFRECAYRVVEHEKLVVPNLEEACNAWISHILSQVRFVDGNAFPKVDRSTVRRVMDESLLEAVIEKDEEDDPVYRPSKRAAAAADRALAVHLEDLGADVVRLARRVVDRKQMSEEMAKKLLTRLKNLEGNQSATAQQAFAALGGLKVVHEIRRYLDQSSRFKKKQAEKVKKEQMKSPG
jgi:hypothetical protein